MAATHQQVVKVWIAPGCIVCDACEAECPEVFDVQEETCIIRPPAQADSFTRPLTPSIIAAAEGCPVDVIKFDTVEVEGEPPWAGKEAEAAAAGAGGGGSGGGAAKKAGPVIPDGPPDPKWAGLLAHAHSSGAAAAIASKASSERPSAKAPAEAVAAALPKNAPPDAVLATMVGSGYARPRPSLGERIRTRAAGIASAVDVTRRDFNFIVLAAWGAILFVAGTVGAAFQSFLVPKVTKEPPSSFRAGKISDYPTPGVYEQYKGKNVWIVYLPDGKLVALSTICTHLGCIPNWLPGDAKFKCPCHGSGFYMDGINFEGPAPRPLERLKISLDGEFVVVDKSMHYRQELGQWNDTASYLLV